MNILKKFTLISLVVFLFFLLISCRQKNRDLSFEVQTVDDNVHGIASIFACDLDNDGDTDILGASVEENAIVYYENNGGQPVNWQKQVIGDEFQQAVSVYAADLDNDADLDVIGAAYGGSEVAVWYNSGTNPPEWEKETIKSEFTFAHEVFACDLDLDGDNDIMAASTKLNSLCWWRNDRNDKPLWVEQVIDSTFIYAKSIRAADFDRDGDQDVAGAALDGNEIAWWENRGGTPFKWVKHSVDSSFMGAHRVQTIDMDGDQDMDIVGTAYYGDMIAWWENKGGVPIEWQKHIVADNFERACIAQAADLDNDGDLDIAGSAQKSNAIAYWQNFDSRGKLWHKAFSDSLLRAWSLYICDFDLDGDNDIIAASGPRGSNALKIWINRLIE